MKARHWKYMALVVTGGIMLQLTGCIAGLLPTLAQNVLGLVLSSLLGSLVPSTTTPTGG